MANDRGCSLRAMGLAFVTGGLAGAPVALLLAPQSGRESREQVRRYGVRRSHGAGGVSLCFRRAVFLER